MPNTIRLSPEVFLPFLISHPFILSIFGIILPSRVRTNNIYFNSFLSLFNLKAKFINMNEYVALRSNNTFATRFLTISVTITTLFDV